MKIRTTLAGLLCGVLSLLGITLTTSPAQAAEQPTRLTASDYGPAIYYDTNTGDGYQWKRFQRGTSRNFDSNDAFKSNAKSFALIRGLYRVQCYNIPANKPVRVPQNEDDAFIQTYPKQGCKN